MSHLEGHPVPPFHGPSSKGATIHSSDFLGKVPMLICIIGSATEALPSLHQMSDALASFGERRVQLLAIASNTAAEVRQTADDAGLNVPIIADPDGTIGRLLDADVLTPPYAILVDSSGNVCRVATLPRERTIGSDLLALIDTEVAANPAAFAVLPSMLI